MAGYRLIYWNKRGRAEQIRLLLNELGADYEDAAITHEELAERRVADRLAFPFGSVPVLEDGDFRLAQGPVILSYLAQKHGLVAGNTKLLAQADSIALGAEDLRLRYFGLFGPNAAERQRRFVEGDFNGRWLPGFEALLGANGERGVFAGDGLTHADIAVFDVLDSMITWVAGATLEGQPRLRAFYESLRARPRIAAYLASPRRPSG